MKKLTIERQKELFGLEPNVIVTYTKTKEGSVRLKTTEYEPNAVQAVRKLVGMNPVNIKVRACLSCNEKFESEGIQNRICLDCQSNGSRMI